MNNVLVSYVNIPNTKADYDLLIPYGVFLTEKEIFIDNVKKNILRVNFIPIDSIAIIFFIVLALFLKFLALYL